MILKHIHIDNLKCFSKLSLPLASLSLLTGFNASGKSTVLHTILLLSQAIRSGNTKEQLPLNGSIVRLGSPGEVLHDQAESNELSLGVETAEAHIAWGLKAESGNTGLTISEIFYRSGRDTKTISSTATSFTNLLPQTELPEAVISTAENLGEIIFISAVRDGISDTFPSPDSPEPIHADVGANGQYAAWWLDLLGDEEVAAERCHDSEQATTLRRQLNAWCAELFPGAQANAQTIARTPLVRLELKNSDTSDWRRPANTGYGLTYALPILVAGLIAKQGQVLVIDSPEAHLHPLGQSQMGRFLSRIAASGVQVIVETHSDHVLNGARLAVSKGQIATDDVAIHFFNPSSESGPAQVISPSINPKGNLSEWPFGFFDQAEKDLASLAGWD